MKKKHILVVAILKSNMALVTMATWVGYLTSNDSTWSRVQLCQFVYNFFKLKIAMPGKSSNVAGQAFSSGDRVRTFLCHFFASEQFPKHNTITS